MKYFFKKHNLGKKQHFSKRSAHNPHTGRAQAILRGSILPRKSIENVLMSIDADGLPGMSMGVHGYPTNASRLAQQGVGQQGGATAPASAFLSHL